MIGNFVLFSRVHMVCLKRGHPGGFGSDLVLEDHEMDKLRYDVNAIYVVVILTTADILWGLFSEKVKSLSMIGKIGGK